MRGQKRTPTRKDMFTLSTSLPVEEKWERHWNDVKYCSKKCQQQ